MIARRTPLAARTPLHRGKPLERKTPLLARKPLRAAAGLARTAPKGKHRAGSTMPASAPETFSPAVCALVDARDGDDSGAVLVRLCQRCGSTRNLHRHHRRLKQKGGSSNRPHTHCPCNAVTVCLACHDEIHDQASRREMEAEGWIVSQAVDEPGAVGVMRFAAAEGGATQWPSCSGAWLETAAEAREVA